MPTKLTFFSHEPLNKLKFSEYTNIRAPLLPATVNSAFYIFTCPRKLNEYKISIRFLWSNKFRMTIFSHLSTAFNSKNPSHSHTPRDEFKTQESLINMHEHRALRLKLRILGLEGTSFILPLRASHCWLTEISIFLGYILFPDTLYWKPRQNEAGCRQIFVRDYNKRGLQRTQI